MKLLLLPLPVRIFHWLMFTAVVVLLFTGLYLDSPPVWIVLPLSLIRKLHGMAAALLMMNLFGQVYYYIRSRKFSEILLLPRDWANLRSFLRYSLFITERHPNFGRYNPGQKALFTFWGLVVTVASVTGLILFFPDDTLWLQKLLGGLGSIRALHYLGAIAFVASIPLHLYLVFTEEPAHLQAMFTGYVQKEPVPCGHRKEASRDRRSP